MEYLLAEEEEAGLVQRGRESGEMGLSATRSRHLACLVCSGLSHFSSPRLGFFMYIMGRQISFLPPRKVFVGIKQLKLSARDQGHTLIGGGHGGSTGAP